MYAPGSIATARCMGQLLCNRRIGCGHADRIAVRRDDVDCLEACTSSGSGRRRICHADNHSPRRRVAFVGADTGSMAIHRARRSLLGPYRPLRSGVRACRGSADAPTNRIPTGVRGLAMSWCAAAGGVRDTRDIGIRDSLPLARGPVRRRSRGSAVVVHRHPQRLGQHLLPRVLKRARYKGMSEADRAS